MLGGAQARSLVSLANFVHIMWHSRGVGREQNKLQEQKDDSNGASCDQGALGRLKFPETGTVIKVPVAAGSAMPQREITGVTQHCEQ